MMCVVRSQNVQVRQATPHSPVFPPHDSARLQRAAVAEAASVTFREPLCSTFQNARSQASCLSAILVLGMSGCIHGTRPGLVDTPDLAREPGAIFTLEGKPFCFAGTNNYYLTYRPRADVDDLLESAKSMQLKVIRVWAFLDRGALDSSVPNADKSGAKDGVYFQYWDPATKKPSFNDGPDGLERLDYLLNKASELNLRVQLVLTNNWREFGGMDQYLMWYGLDKHHEFFTDARVKAAYKAYAAHLIERRNVLDGRVYREDPTIFGWELANEPRCKNGSRFDGTGFTPQTLTAWADEMSAYIKSLDPNHLVSVGDEGFLDAGGQHFAYQANDGVSHGDLLALPHIDFGTFHLYPDHWQTSVDWGAKWIDDHVALARKIGKPTLLEEYGLRKPKTAGEEAVKRRNEAYALWNDHLLAWGAGGSSFWMLAGKAGVDLYPDYDGFTVYRDSSTGELLSRYAREFSEAPVCTSPSAREVALQAPSPFVRVAAPRQVQ